MNKEEIAQIIRAAFESRADPPDRVVECGCEECAEFQADMKGKSWQSLGLHEVYGHAIDIALLSPQAFRYYLPSYLLNGLGDESEAWDIRMYTLHMLAGPSDSRMRPWFSARFDALNDEQVQAVTEWLAYIALHERDDLAQDASKAHASLWEPMAQSRTSRRRPN